MNHTQATWHCHMLISLLMRDSCTECISLLAVARVRTSCSANPTSTGKGRNLHKPAEVLRTFVKAEGTINMSDMPYPIWSETEEEEEGKEEEEDNLRPANICAFRQSIT